MSQPQIQVQRTAFGIMQTQVVCDQCDGTGEVIAEKCPDCKGAGALQTNKQIKIDIPAGVQDGTKLRIKGNVCLFVCEATVAISE